MSEPKRTKEPDEGSNHCPCCLKAGDAGGQALQKFKRAHHQINDPIAIRRFEWKDNLAGRGPAQPFVAQGLAREIATQTFKFLPLMGSTRRIGMQAKPLGTDTALGLRYLWTGKAQRGVGRPSACQSVECHMQSSWLSKLTSARTCPGGHLCDLALPSRNPLSASLNKPQA